MLPIADAGAGRDRRAHPHGARQHRSRCCGSSTSPMRAPRALPERRVLWPPRAAQRLRADLDPDRPVLGNLLGGIAVVETVFTLPGLGRLLVGRDLRPRLSGGAGLPAVHHLHLCAGQPRVDLLLSAVRPAGEVRARMILWHPGRRREPPAKRPVPGQRPMR